MTIGFDGHTLSYLHQRFGVDLLNLPESGEFLPPNANSINFLDLSVLSGSFIWRVTVSNTMIHYGPIFGGQIPGLTVLNVDTFSDNSGSLPPILGAALLTEGLPYPVSIATGENDIVVSYPAIFIGG